MCTYPILLLSDNRCRYKHSSRYLCIKSWITNIKYSWSVFTKNKISRIFLKYKLQYLIFKLSRKIHTSLDDLATCYVRHPVNYVKFSRTRNSWNTTENLRSIFENLNHQVLDLIRLQITFHEFCFVVIQYYLNYKILNILSFGVKTLRECFCGRL